MSKTTKAEKILIIVESPNKVKTISKILKDAGYSKAVVLASVGHIMALADGGPAYNSGIYPKQKFRMNLAIAEGKQKVVDEINEIFIKYWGCPKEAISISMEEFSPEEWETKVVKPQIETNLDKMMVLSGEKKY